MMFDASPPSPPGSGPPPTGPQSPQPAEKKHRPTGQFEFTKSHEFLGMHFEPEDWNKLMNIFLKNMNDYINKTFQKMTEKMKKDWKRGAGEQVDD